ncbi:MAG: hypothetical protein KIT18_11850, partial [Burkholderiales bacterium]|nr:hypothetical protein [Burkholderiales bacterium]
MGRRLKGSTFSLLQFFIFTAVATILSSGLLTRDAAADPSVVAQDEVIPAVNRVAFAVDRGVLATTHTDGLRLWTTSGTLLRTFRAPGIRWIGAAAFADDRLVLAAVGWEATATAYIPVLVVWDTFSGAVRSVARLPEAEPPAGAVEEGDVDIAFVDGQIRVARLDRVLFVNPQTHEVREVARRTPPAPVGLRRMFDHPQYVFERSGGSARAQVVAPAGAYVLTQGGQEAAQLWSTETARVVADMPGSPSHVRPVALTRDGRRALVLGLGWRVLFWKTDSGTTTMLDPAAISPHRVFSDEIGPEFLPSIGELSPAGDLAFITDVASAAIVIADTDTGQVVGRLPGRGVSGLFVAPNGRFLAARGPAGIEVWDIGRRSLIGRIGTRETPAFLGSSVDGRRLLSVSRSASRAVLWDIDGFRQFAQFSVPSVDRPGARTEFSATDDLRYLMRYALFDARYDRPTDIDPVTMWDTQAGIVAPADRPAAMQRAVATNRGSWFLIFNCVGRDDGFLYPNGGHHPVDMLFNQRGRCIRLPDGRTDIFLRQESGGDERVVFESGQDRRPVARLPFAQHRSFNFSRDGAYLVVREWLDWRFWIIDLSTGVEIGPAQDGPATEGDIAITSFGAI